MKKEFNKVLMVIGFIIATLGAIIMPFMSYGFESLVSTAFIAPILAVCFIFAKNGVLKNVGYALTVLCGIDGFSYLSFASSIGDILISTGLLIMFLATILYFLLLCLKFFGFVKSGKSSTVTSDPIQILTQYKELVNEKIVTEEEFEELKKNILANNETKVSNIEELKKWKKALDQKIITEEEYANVKTAIFTK